MNRTKIKSKNFIEILTEEELDTVPVKTFLKGNMEYYNSDVVFYFLKEGSAKVSIYKGGDEFILYQYNKSNIYVPERQCVLEFLVDSKVYIMNNEIIQDLYKNLNFCNFVTDSLSKRSILQREIIYDLAFNTSKEKIISFMLASVDFKYLCSNKKYHVDLKMTINELSKYINVRRQTISSFLNKVMKENIIERTGHDTYIIHDISRLKSFSCT